MNVYLDLIRARSLNGYKTPKNGVPKGIRTPVAAVKGQCPRPLDDGDLLTVRQNDNFGDFWWS